MMMKDEQVINIIKGLILDGIDTAQSGHPGGALSSLNFAYSLFTKYLNFDFEDPNFMGRDRFILSAGHESMLLYSLLTMIGWLDIEDLKKFRQLGSKTPGHPEYGVTPGVECSTGPLGQGAAMSVGFAMAAAHLGANIDKDIFDYKIYSLLGDGCMQEDIVLNAATLAGHFKLKNLVWYYDKNNVQISGPISTNTSYNIIKIFKAMGWLVYDINGDDFAAVDNCLRWVSSDHKNGPILIVANSTIAKGCATMEGSNKTHGAPLSKEELLETKKLLNLPIDEKFYLPYKAQVAFKQYLYDKKQYVKAWKKQLSNKLEDPKFKIKYEKYFSNVSIEKLMPVKWEKETKIATRSAFGDLLAAWSKYVPNLIGGSADLVDSNGLTKYAEKFPKEFSRRSYKSPHIYFGVREFPMAAICNGLAIHGGCVPFCTTFLVFSDYCRAAIRMAALQGIRVIYGFTHDSFYVGEDGPTHHPIEHIMSFRLMPNIYVMRPADALETEALLKTSLTIKSSPSVFCLTRQKLNFLPIDKKIIFSGAEKGAYIIPGSDEANIEFIIFATGSEVQVALKTAELLGRTRTRVVSVPCWELFFNQSEEYQNKILDFNITKRISIEAGSTLGWQKFTGQNGLNIGIDHFGLSGKSIDLEKKFGLTPEDIVLKINNAF